jgi:hypothetical protein
MTRRDRDSPRPPFGIIFLNSCRGTTARPVWALAHRAALRSASDEPGHPRQPSAGRVTCAMLGGAVTGAVVSPFMPPAAAILVGWDIAVVIYLAWVWSGVASGHQPDGPARATGGPKYRRRGTGGGRGGTAILGAVVEASATPIVPVCAVRRLVVSPGNSGGNLEEHSWV